VEHLGASVEAAAGGEEAMSMLKRAPFDLLLVDGQMPGSDGFEVARCAQNLPLRPAIVMMLGSSGLHSDAAECRRLGIEQYVVKPVSETELTPALHRALNGFSNDFQAPVFSQRIPLTEAGALSVLLAEDNPVNQKLATRLLEKMGHLVTLAANGSEAVRAHTTGRFDVILMDVQMPEMNGFEATALIRGLEQRTGEHVQIVALTAHAIQGDRERCLAAGMDDYLSKPLNAVALAEKLEAIARKGEPVKTSV
jgi:two-component system, sensor histidine kinase and response regulator